MTNLWIFLQEKTCNTVKPLRISEIPNFRDFVILAKQEVHEGRLCICYSQYSKPDKRYIVENVLLRNMSAEQCHFQDKEH